MINKFDFFRLSVLTLLLCFSNSIIAQDAVVFGRVTDIDSKKAIDFVTVFLEGTSIATETDENGEYRLEIEAGTTATIKFSRIGYIDASAVIPAMASGDKRYVNIKLAPESSDLEVVVRESRIEDIGMVREEVGELLKLPSASGNLESVLPSIALGTSGGTGGELSSQYNVRGGNYDENLVYVNDFEIFRPQLIRTGQQEGLSFPNIDLVRDLSFSSGGFEAKYGDKLSSVLDIKYKRPEETKGSVSASLLGASAHIEGSKRLGANAYNKFRYLLGARYKTTRYILGSLDTKGEYLPDFTDIQAYLTYDLNRSLQLAFLGNFNNSQYNFTPTERSTTLGLITQALRFTSVFEGGEKDKFTNGTTGLSLTYVPQRKRDPLYIKLLLSNYTSSEQESFDILGFYRLSEIETGLGSDDFGSEIAVLGVGTQHSYTRNYLFNRISSITHKGGVELQLNDDADHLSSNFIQWGAKVQQEVFDDRINEWERLDSAGFSLPVNEENLLLTSALKAENSISLKSQKSTQLVAGLAYDFYWKRMSRKPFKLITELYYKKLENLVSYEIDNVRIRYSGENDAEGSVAGLDIRVNGEFVPGAESWINLSFLKASETLVDVQHLKFNTEDPDVPEEVDFVPRPTDQFMTLAMFFQDYLPNNENFKMFLNLAVGTGLPFGIKDNNQVYRNTFRYKPYHRVDIGFGYQLWKSEWRKNKPKHPLRFAQNAWLSLEVFNLLEVANVANNTWIKTITNSQFAIPNFLTSRRINLRVRFDL